MVTPSRGRGRGRKAAVTPVENFRLGREWRRDYLNDMTATEWVAYAKRLNTPCPICGNIHTGESCVVDPGV